MPSSVASSSTPVAHIDLSALARNYHAVERLVGQGVGIIAMVKGDAYGHGAHAVVETLFALGCRRFGLATLEEAEELQDGLGEVAADAELLVFGGLVPADAPFAVQLGVTVVTHSEAVVEALAREARRHECEVSIHIKVDTGMSRLGVPVSGVAALGETVVRTPGVRLAGLCSHFAQADSVTGDATVGQLEALRDASVSLPVSTGPLDLHLANSAAVLTRPESHLDLVRPGLMLYGLLPHPRMADAAELEPVMKLEATVLRVEDVEAGRGVSYGHTYVAPTRRRIATLRCGYADGYPRCLSNRGEVSVRGIRAPVVGTVCMHHTMIDVTEIEAARPGSVRVGDQVTVMGGDIAVDEVAVRARTISYELVTRVGNGVRRVYASPVVPGRATSGIQGAAGAALPSGKAPR